MSLSIRERSQKVADSLKENVVVGISAMAEALGISYSSVHRHQQGILRRQQYPESEWWETSVGSGWLKLMVLGVVYYFGIKQGVGAERLSEFLAAIRIDEQVGSERECVADAETADEASPESPTRCAQSSECQPKAGTGICVGGDETFFGGLPILVMMELASGFILTEVACENRTYQTWSEQLAQWWSQTGWQCHFMVSDGAQALIKLAVTGLSCVSVADLFHALRALAQPLGSAISRNTSQLQKHWAKLQLQVDKTTDESQRQALQQSLDTLDQQQQGRCACATDLPEGITHDDSSGASVPN